MSLSRQRVQFLTTLFAEIESDPRKLNDGFEKDFMKDQKERFDKYGAEMFLSMKQLGVINRVAEKYQVVEEDASDEV